MIIKRVTSLQHLQQHSDAQLSEEEAASKCDSTAGRRVFCCRFLMGRTANMFSHMCLTWSTCMLLLTGVSPSVSWLSGWTESSILDGSQAEAATAMWHTLWKHKSPTRHALLLPWLWVSYRSGQPWVSCDDFMTASVRSGGCRVSVTHLHKADALFSKCH